MNVLQAVEEAYRAYEGEKGYIGFSENGAGIPYFLIGRGAPVVLAQFSFPGILFTRRMRGAWT